MTRKRPKLTKQEATPLLRRAAAQLLQIAGAEMFSLETRRAAITGGETLLRLSLGQNPEGKVWHKTAKATPAKNRNVRAVLEVMNDPECASLFDAYDLAATKLQAEFGESPDERTLERNFVALMPEFVDAARDVLAKRRKKGS